MVDKNYWFEKEEYDRRLARVQAQLVAQGHDALLAFMPESVTWLTGFFTRAYSSFQFAIIPASGAPTVVCRDVEAYYLDSTCCYPDRVMWRDSDDKDAVAVNAIRTRLPRARFADAGPLVTQMRFIKSAAEIAYQRGAGGRGGYAGRYRLSQGRRE